MNRHASPSVSVIMYLKNACARFLRQSLLCIAQQKDVDFELIVAADAASAHLEDVLYSYPAEKFTCLKNPSLRTEADLLNQLLDAAQGTYVAFTDCNAITLSHRLRQQVAFLEQRPDYALMGGPLQILGQPLPQAGHPVYDHEQLLQRLSLPQVFVLPTIMVRHALVQHQHLRFEPDIPVGSRFFPRLLRQAKGFVSDAVFTLCR